MYESEGRGVRADADGENDQRGEGEPGPRAELAQRLAHIEEKPSHVDHRTSGRRGWVVSGGQGHEAFDLFDVDGSPDRGEGIGLEGLAERRRGRRRGC